MLRRDRPILAGVSGGPDSLCLADALVQLGYTLIIAHLDHNLRSESATEAETVRNFSQTLGAGFILGREDVAAFATCRRLSLEEAAREARYRFLFEQCQLHNAQAVAVGHNADDQVETVLMHLMRGAGMSGLRGMHFRSLPNAWSQDIPLVRPLLGVWRSSILEYLQLRGLQPNIDPSNQDMRFYRNRLRHELLPHLEALNPGVRQRIWQTAAVLNEEDVVMDSLVDAAWAACWRETGQGCLAFSADALRAQPAAVQRRLFRRAIGSLRPGLRNLDFAAIQRAQGFLTSPTRTSRLDLGAGLRLEMEDECLWLAAWEADLPGTGWPQTAHGQEFLLSIPGELVLPGGWRLRAEILPANRDLLSQAAANQLTYQAYLDLDRLEMPLHIRPRLPGERFRPLGLDGHSLKLSDYMINVQMPRRARPGWPLLVSAGQVAWVPGFGISQDFALIDTTRQVVRCALEPEAAASV